MTRRSWLTGAIPAVVLILVLLLSPAPACCPAPARNKAAVNADQTVILLWDPATKTEHFIRKASFKSDAEDFGFLIPSPSKPELSESGDDAFPLLATITAPEVVQRQLPRGGPGCGCGSGMPAGAATKSEAPPPAVSVLEEKLVAGFHAAVLETKSSDELVGWLKEHGYAFSPEVREWAKPYVEQGWKITALKVVKGDAAKEKKDVGASALRMSFQTDRPLFPYREPDPRSYAAALKAQHRTLRIYFLADGRYRGELTKEEPWTGRVAWCNPVKENERATLLEKLKLPKSTGAADWWLTEFEDDWPYRAAPADVYFSRDTNQSTLKRPPIIQYVQATLPDDVSGYALAVALVLPPLLRRARSKRTRPVV
jgi:hypothetical protein